MRSIVSVVVILFICAFADAAETITRAAAVHTPPIRAAQKWNPFWSLGNADDPQPPAWFHPGEQHRQWRWRMRNPLHNFTHYIIGVSDKAITRTGKFPGAVFAPSGGWNWAVTRYRWLRLPFVSFENARCHFYLGWRESGNFGGKLNLGTRTKTAEKIRRPAASKI